MAHLDPSKIKVQSNALPVWETEVSFQDMMAERLRQAPWLILSAAIHGVVILILWVLYPVEEKKKIENKLEMQDTQQQQVDTGVRHAGADVLVDACVEIGAKALGERHRKIP